MCTLSEQTLGKCVPSMTQTIISKCSRTWSRERRNGVLHRSLEPRLSVWDCVPEHIIDAQVKDAFEYLPAQRDYILYYAIPGSAIVRSIRRLDGYRSSPLVLWSLRFCSEGEVDAYHFPQELAIALDFSLSEYEEDGTISRESTPLPTSVSDIEENDIHTAIQDDDSESEDEAVCGKPQQWVEYPEPENIEICSGPQQSASDVDDEASSPEPRELFTIYECDEELEDSRHSDEPVATSSPEPNQVSPVYQPRLEFDNDEQSDEPLVAESPEPLRLFPFRPESPVPKYDVDEKDDESIESDSPEPRRLFPVHQFHSTVYDPPQPAPQMEAAYCPAPLRRFLEPEEQLKFDAFEDWFVRMHMSKRTTTNASSEEFTSETPSFHFRQETSVPEYDNIDEPEPESPEPRRLFPVHQSHSTVYDTPQPPQMETTYCPAPLRRFLEPEEQLKFDAFEDWFVRMHTSKGTSINPSSKAFTSGTPDFHFRHETSVPEADNDDEPEPESPEPRRLFPVHQSHSTVYDPLQLAPQMETTYCLAPLRRFLEPEEQLKFDAFEDEFVRMHMSKRTTINAGSEKIISDTSSY